MTDNNRYNFFLITFLLFIIIKFLLGPIDSIVYVQILLVFAYGRLIPMVFEVTNLPNSRLLELIQRVHPFAFISATLCFLVEQGTLSTILSLPWLGFTVLFSIFGLLSMKKEKGWRNLQDLLIYAGYMYIVVGGMWLTIHRTGLSILHFKDIIVLLTSIHFHYAAVITLVSFGVMGKFLIKHKPHLNGIYNGLSFLLLIGPIFIAAGITFSPNLPLLEFVSVVEFVVPIAILAFIGLISFVSLVEHKRGKAYFIIAFLSLFVSMTFAFLYGYGHLGHGSHDHRILDIPLMIFVHGFVNAAFSWFMLQGIKYSNINKRVPY